MNRVTGGFLTAAIGVGLAIGLLSGAFGPFIARVTALVRGTGDVAAAPVAAVAGGSPSRVP